MLSGDSGGGSPSEGANSFGPIPKEGGGLWCLFGGGGDKTVRYM